MLEVEDYLKSLKIDGYVVCATSGGADSMTLLYLLNKVYPKKVVCAHVNHQKREESKEEKVFVENYCKQNDIKFEYLLLEKNHDDNFQKYARNKRYEFFKETCLKYKSNYLFTAHHNDDLIETILMRLSRGSSLIGYAGFKKEIVEDGINIVKPLITISKREILDYTEINNIEYRNDKSNDSDDYTRNRYRHHIIPLLKKECPNLKEKYLKYNETLIKYNNFVLNYINDIYSKIVKDNTINIKLLNCENVLIKEEIIKRYLKNIYGDDIDLISDNNINGILNMIQSNRPNYYINLPKNVVINKKYDIIYINSFREKLSNYKVLFQDNLQTSCGKFQIKPDNNSKSNYVTRLNTKELKMPLFVRNKKDGDIINVKGINKNKKLKSIFINEKVDINYRNTIPLLVDNEDKILFIPGIKKSAYDKEKDEDFDLTIEFIKEER